MPKYRRVIVILWLALGGIAVQQSPAQVTVTIPASRDNTIYESATGTVSNGAGAYLFAGRTNRGEQRRALLVFDVAGHVPAGAVIQSARLTLNMSRSISGVHAVALHRVLVDWGEGTSNAPLEEGAGATATTGDATWLHTFFNSQFWTNQGGDFSSTATATVSIGNLSSYTWDSTPEMVDEVQSWLDEPAENFGWMLINTGGNSSAKRFDSRENPVAANRPSLEIVYEVVTSVDRENGGTPTEFALAQNFPNPFNPTTTIRYDLPRETLVSLVVYDVLGKPIRTLANGMEVSGIKRHTWDGRDDHGRQVSGGIYIYRLEAGTFSQVRKLTLIK